MKTAIVGGGASGMIAAITAARLGADVTVFEHMNRIGKKILLTGSGKCNISNTDMDISHFHSGCIERVRNVLSECPPEKTGEFWESIGLRLRDRNGYLYPYSEQASAVLDVLRFTIRDMDIEVHTDTDIKMIEYNGTFVISTKSGRFTFDRVIMCCGSCVNRNTGSDGSGYELAARLGHTVIKPLPALTFLTCEEDFFPSIAGIRTNANISIYSSTGANSPVLLGEEYGQLQLTKSGISGIPVFNLSHLAIRAMDNGEKVCAAIDLIPEIDMDEIFLFLKKRAEDLADRTIEEFFIGLLAKPLGICICKRCMLAMNQKVSSLDERSIDAHCRAVKRFETNVNGSGGFEDAQVASGGVDLAQLNDKLESRIVPGLYFAGEMIDVNGDCGGYNLQWAASSAIVAGSACNA
ncbi:MAG: aminoacetone oxidase family FAD-binding enzyme [Lachnospiraceae bacterium]|nr:aminoacetone oxidase family FAD-binding enzyme [Lachnospiraceae bacterium]